MITDIPEGSGVEGTLVEQHEVNKIIYLYADANTMSEQQVVAHVQEMDSFLCVDKKMTGALTSVSWRGPWWSPLPLQADL